MNQWIPWIAGSFALMGVVVACRSAQPEAPATDYTPAPVPMAMRDLASGHLSTMRTNECVVARTETEWAALWKRHGGMQLPAPDLPTVNFEEDMVLAVFLGERPTGGYSVAVRAVDLIESAEDGDQPATLAVYAREVRPLKNAIQPQVVITPFHMVLVPANEGQVELHMER